MKTSEIFRAAKAFLAMNPDDERNGKTEFICHAIDRTQGNFGQKEAICKMVTGRLGDDTATGWLTHRGVCIPDNDPADMGLARPAVQLWRQAWLDQLVAEFEAKGD